MDISSSQYNSGSESGWTHYLDESSVSQSYMVEYEGKGATMEEEEEEEDLSMVSDASSGPPHYHEEDDHCVSGYPSTSQCTKESKKKKKKVKKCGKNQQPSPLEDTASSPVLNFPKKKVSFSGNGLVDNTLDFSQCFSATRRKKHLSLFERSIGGGKQASEEPGDFDEEQRK